MKTTFKNMNRITWLVIVSIAAMFSVASEVYCETVSAKTSADTTFVEAAKIDAAFNVTYGVLSANEECIVTLNGTELLSSTNSRGVFTWQPRKLGMNKLVWSSVGVATTTMVDVASLTYYVQPEPNPPMPVDANVAITPETRTFEQGGGGGAIITSGSGTWTAAASEPWIVLNATSGNAGNPVAYIVSASALVGDRVGYVYVSGRVHTVTQHGYASTISPASAEFETQGGSGTVAIRTTNRIAWNAKPNADWITITPTCGTGSGTISYTVAPYNEVATRTGTITVGDQTFTVKQTGRRIKLSTYREVRTDYFSHVIPVTVNALASTHWSVTPNASWISVVDAGNGVGSDSVGLAIADNLNGVTRYGTVTIGTETLLIVQGESITIAPETATADVNGANGFVAVGAWPEVSWIATIKSNWLSILGNTAQGTGCGNVVYTASPNPTLYERTGTIEVVENGGQHGYPVRTHTVIQPAATATVSPMGYEFGAGGGSCSVFIDTASIVRWKVEGCPNWLTVPTGAEGIGSQAIRLQAAENNTVYSRTVTLKIAENDFVVTQRGRGVEVEYDSILFGTDGGLGSFSIHPDGDVAWQAVSSDPTWITVFQNDSGTGDAAIQYIVSPYVDNGAARTGYIAVGDKKVYITQRAYEMNIDPYLATVTGDAGSGQVGISAPIGSVWEAIATEPWIKVMTTTGSGSGAVTYQFTENLTGKVRSGKIIISGEEYTITQMCRVVMSVGVEGHGSVTGAGTYDYGANVTLTATPEDGYRFSHWSGAASGTDNPLKVRIDEACEVVAHFVSLFPEISSITYANLNGAMHSNPATYQEGTVVSFAPPSVRTGYTFTGWTPTAVTADMTGAQTVTAGWRANSYQIVYDANGGSGTMVVADCEYDKEVEIATNGFTRDGYGFKGWARAANGETVYYPSGAKVMNLTAVSGGVVKLYAVWEHLDSPPLEGLVAWYKFDGNANDASGNGNNGTVHGATLTSDRFGNANGAYAFQDSKYISVRNSPSLQGVGDRVSIAAWIKPTSWDGDWMILLCKGSGSSGSRNIGFAFHSRNYMEAARAGLSVTISKSLRLGEWQHVAYSSDGATIKVYINGECVGTRQCQCGAIANSDDLQIGCDPFGGIEYFHGSMDDLRIYSRALSADEVKLLYDGQDVEATWSGKNSSPSSWTPNGNNVLRGMTGTFSGTRFNESGRVASSDPLSRLTDGVVNAAGSSFANTIGIRNGTLTWQLPSPANLTGLRINTHWCDGGRDGINLTSVEIQQNGSSLWTALPNSAFDFGTNNNMTSGDLEFLYTTESQSVFAESVTAIRFNLGTQDNSGTGFTEFEAIAANLQTYTIAFNANGGSCSTSSKQYSSGSTLGTLPTATRSGYELDGWYTAKSGGTKVTGSMMMTESMTLYAHWTPIGYVIRFNVNGGDGSMADELMTYDVAKALSANEFTKNGCAFMGWSLSVGGAVKFADGEEAINLTAELGDVVNLYAVWESEGVETPVITPEDKSNFETANCTVTITCATEGATIYYSTNGRTPSAKSAFLYTGPFEITDTATIIAMAVKGEKQSEYVEATITKVIPEPLTLVGVLDEPKLANVTTGGDAEWLPIDDATAKVGGSCAVSGALDEDGEEESTWLEAKVYGKGTLTFWWRVSCEPDPRSGKFTYDFAAFEADDEVVVQKDGESDWVQVTKTFTADGEHVIRWSYNTDGYPSDDYDGCVWVDGVTWSGATAPEELPKPTIEGDEGATVTGDAETGFVVKPSGGKSTVEVSIPQGVDAAKVTVEVPTKVASVKPNGAKVKIVSGGADITEFLNVPTADGNGVVDLTKATVKEEVVKETLDTAKGAVVELNAADSKLTTAPTRAGLFYQLREGETLGGMKDGDSKVGDGRPWSPEIKVKGGKSGFYSIGVGKGE